MFVQLVDTSNVPTIINTDAITHIQVSVEESQEDPTQLEVRHAVVSFNNSSSILLDEENYGALMKVIAYQ